VIQGNVEGLVPNWVLACILVDKGLLKGFGAGNIQGELEIGILLAKGLNLSLWLYCTEKRRGSIRRMKGRSRWQPQ